MSIKVGEIGKALYVGTTFNLNAAPFTELTLNFVSPDGTITFSRTTADGITAPAVDSPALDSTGVLPANTYMLYLTQASDFTVAGDWTVQAQYNDATPSEFFGCVAVLTILSADTVC